MKRGVWFAGELKVERMVDLAVKSEQAGLDSVWVGEIFESPVCLTPNLALILTGESTRTGPAMIRSAYLCNHEFYQPETLVEQVVPAEKVGFAT